MPHSFARALAFACALLAPALFQPASAQISGNDPRVIATDCLLVGNYMKKGASRADKKKLKAASRYFEKQLDGEDEGMSSDDLIKARKAEMDEDVAQMGREGFVDEFSDIYWQGCYAMVPERDRPDAR